MILQCNVKGAWRNVIACSDEDRQRVVDAVRVLAAVDPHVTWCLLHESGKREWFEAEASAAKAQENV